MRKPLSTLARILFLAPERSDSGVPGTGAWMKVIPVLGRSRLVDFFQLVAWD